VRRLYVAADGALKPGSTLPGVTTCTREAMPGILCESPFHWSAPVTFRARALLVLVVAAVLVASSASWAQPPLRRIATVTAIKTYHGFYHGQQVLVRGELQDVEAQRPTLVDEEDSIRLLMRDMVPAAGTYEVRGDVIDVGRLTANDPRLSGIDLRTLGVDVDDRWPRQGEVVVLRAASLEPAQPLAAPTIRTIALDPWRYLDQRVTVAGQFRGRNLFGDVPQAPSAAQQTRGAFVLRSADGAVWALGRQPRGRGFQLNPTSRRDTQRWLEVSGIVRQGRGLVWIDIDEVREVEPRQEEVTAREAAPEPPTLIRPEVLFSAPTEGEIDVAVDARVRVQFSRDLDPRTLKGGVRASYLGAPPEPDGQPPALGLDLRYDGGRRALEIAFTEPLEPFRTVRVAFGEGITSTDGAPLHPWSLTFSVGAP
jgi:hypothetical protein